MRVSRQQMLILAIMVFLAVALIGCALLVALERIVP
jgi:hypothetical protein